MRLNLKRNHVTSAFAAEADPGLRDILNGTEIPTAYKIGYILNFYREPSFRAIETEFGLTRPEIVILLALHFREGITASEFCEFSGHLKAGVSRAVIALEKKRLIRRQTDAGDNRRQRLYLMAGGRNIYQRYIPALRVREQAMLSCLSATERRQFERLLDKLAAHVPQWGSLSEL
jgi:MarR family transcriptional regulator, temperature-dependent positive regulator of motility